MNATETPPTVEDPVVPLDRAQRDWIPLYALAACLVAAASAWYLLRELAPLLRPLVLAVFLAYIIVPVHIKLKRHIPPAASAALIAAGTMVLLYSLAAMVYGSVVELEADLPRLASRARDVVRDFREYGRTHLPRWLVEMVPDAGKAGVAGTDALRSAAGGLVNAAAGAVAEAFVVGLYLIFMLWEVRRVPSRIEAGFGAERGSKVLGVLGRINVAMVSYLRAKVVTSLIAAVPTTIVLWAFGVKFPMLWGVVTFFGNFIPYVGGVAAFALPVLLAFLDLEPLWRPCTVALLLVAIQGVTSNLIEPPLTGKAVDIGALVVMISLAFWGLCWGLTGMLLAVPLTAMLRIVWENIPLTRPLARLISED